MYISNLQKNVHNNVYKQSTQKCTITMYISNLHKNVHNNVYKQSTQKCT